MKLTKQQLFFIALVIFASVLFIVARSTTSKQVESNSGNAVQRVNDMFNNQSQISTQSITTQLQSTTIIYRQPTFLNAQFYEKGELVNIKDILKKVVVTPDSNGGSDIDIDLNFQAPTQTVRNAYASQPKPSGGYASAVGGDPENYAYLTPANFEADIDALYIALYKNHIIDPNQLDSVTVNSYARIENQYGNVQDTLTATTSLSKNDGAQFNWSLDNSSIQQLLRNLWVQRYPQNNYLPIQ